MITILITLTLMSAALIYLIFENLKALKEQAIEEGVRPMEINVVLEEGAYMPKKAHDIDAGFDIRMPDIKNVWTCVPARGSLKVDTKVHIEIPPGYVGFLKSKSGLYVNKDITCEGVIDSGYTGSIVAKLVNSASTDYFFKSGDKITQLVIIPIPEVELKMVKELKATERGDNGFGSTGR